MSVGNRSRSYKLVRGGIKKVRRFLRRGLAAARAKGGGAAASATVHPTLPINGPCVIVDLGAGRLLLDDLAPGARLTLTIDVPRRLSVLGIRIGTHTGQSLGDLTATLTRREDRSVAYQGAVSLADTPDNGFALFEVGPPVGPGTYDVEVGCRSAQKTPTAAFYLQQQGRWKTALVVGHATISLPASLDLILLEDEQRDFDPMTPSARRVDEVVPAIVRSPEEIEASLPLKIQALPGSSIVVAGMPSGDALLSNFEKSVVLLQLLRTEEPLLAVGATIGTHHGAARGELKVRVRDVISGVVIFEGTRQVAKLTDNDVVTFALRPPAPAGRYLLEFGIDREQGTVSPAIYLKALDPSASSLRLVEQGRHMHLEYALDGAATLRTRSGYAALHEPGARALAAISCRRPAVDDPCSLKVAPDGGLFLTDIFRDLTLSMDLPRWRGDVAAIGLKWRKPAGVAGRLWLTLRARETGEPLLTNSYDLSACSDDRPLLIRSPSGALPNRDLRLDVRCETVDDRVFASFRCRTVGSQAGSGGLMVEGKTARVVFQLVRERATPFTRSEQPLPVHRASPLRGGIEYVFPKRVTGWMQAANTPLIVTIESPGGASAEQVLAPDSIVGPAPADIRYRLFDLGASVGAHPGLVDDRTVRVYPPVAESSVYDVSVRYPLRRLAMRSQPFDAYLHRARVNSVTGIGEIQLGARRTRRVALFAMFHEEEGLFPHQRELAGAMRDAGFYVVGINSSLKIGPGTLAQMRETFDGVILRTGDGMDFGSWLVGWSCLGPAVAHLDELALINDSCLPIGDVGALIAQLRGGRDDVRGVTESWEQNYHLQSFLLLFKASAIHSRAFHQWANGYGFPHVREEVIRQGELGLTQALVGSGLRVSAAFAYEHLAAAWMSRNAPLIDAEADAVDASGRRARKERLYIRDAIVTGQPLNPMAYFTHELVADFGCPLIKKEPYVRSTKPYHLGDLRAILQMAAERSPSLNDMLIAAARVQSRGIAPPMAVSGDVH